MDLVSIPYQTQTNWQKLKFIFCKNFLFIVFMCNVFELISFFLFLFFSGSVGGKKLVGMCCIFSNRSKGYIYDVFSETKQVTVLSFMTR